MLVFLLYFSFASIPKDSTLQYLQKPKEIRMAYFETRPDKLKEILSDSSANFRNRWAAYSTWVSLNPTEKRLNYGFKSHHWYFRDLALKLAIKYNQDMAYKWSKKLLKDPALVVRTSAAKNLAKLKRAESLDLLWQELYSKRNFRKGQSLWVRKHIVKAIHYSYKGEKQKLWKQRFAKILQDRDESLYPYALSTLANLYPSGPKSNISEPVAIQKKKWLTWIR